MAGTATEVVGTAAGAPVGDAVMLAGPSAARDLCGAPDDHARPLGHEPLTLVRALEPAFANGVISVIAVRVADPTRAFAFFAVRDAAGDSVAARRPESDPSAPPPRPRGPPAPPAPLPTVRPVMARVLA
ncbi:hypothetical protein BG844_22245 [Couchioplanes caeruleus subsp. caeruleus]|uniref:Uncharacterized protein n=2 Tax=Couchioplanes caeruleus TaxID=56438 RepID=A0A1K0FH17_9ACTN|nr:hypothetical protein BG844_22245 [Couchioplanes caeruleus subsp. caeruleus]